jgi:uncharacterized protein VirK/YbjX
MNCENFVKRHALPARAITPSTGDILRLIISAAHEIYPGISPVAVKRRACFVYISFRNRDLLKEFCVRTAQTKPNGTFVVSADMVGVTEWPYINNAWGVADRLDRIAKHYELLSSLSIKLFAVDRNNPLTVVDLSMISSRSEIIVDRAHWFKREGELVLNLFKDNLRAASIAFILGIHNGTPAIFIGAIQGIHSGIPSEESLLIHKNLTKDFEGLRPRSLLIDVLKAIGNALGISKLLAVADENRHHRHKYFGAVQSSKLATAYNQIWIEHGGVQGVDSGFYEIPMALNRREPDEIPSKKRAMYRRRYEILGEIEKEVVSKVK